MKLQLIPPALHDEEISLEVAAKSAVVQESAINEKFLRDAATVSGTSSRTTEAEDTPSTAVLAVPTESNEVNPSALNSRTLLEQIKAQLVNDSEIAAHTRPTKTFSKADFIDPKPPTEQPTSELLPTLFPKAFSGSSRSASGQSTDIIRNARGDAMCWQQRGVPGESQQWYRVPLALCGHLNDP